MEAINTGRKRGDRFIGLERSVWVSVHQRGLGEGSMWTNEAEKLGVGARQSKLYLGCSDMNRFTLRSPEFRAL